MIEKKEVKVFIEKNMCERCDLEMEKSDIVLLSYPAQYQYACTRCNNHENSYILYPRIVYEEL